MLLYFANQPCGRLYHRKEQTLPTHHLLISNLPVLMGAIKGKDGASGS